MKAQKSEDDSVQNASSRVRNVAVSRGLLGQSAAKPTHPLQPSKALLKCDGKDIVKKGNRKTKFLFSFPGLVAPMAGGKFGDLAQLDTRNPVLYVDFPQGRLKMFGTIVYPKNKYLTLQLSKGSKSVVCDDFFEALVVFSEAWWIGTKEDNPEERKLQMPGSLTQEKKHTTYDFAAGAGDPAIETTANDHVQTKGSSGLTQTTLAFQSQSVGEETTPVRQSARLSSRKRSYVEIDVSEDEGTETEIMVVEKQEVEAVTSKSVADAEESREELKKTKGKTMLDFMIQKPAQTVESKQKKQASIKSLLKS